MFFRDSLKSFTIFRTTGKGVGKRKQAVTQAQKVNLASLLEGRLASTNFYRESALKSNVKLVGDSIFVVGLACGRAFTEDIDLIALELDAESFKIKNISHKVYSEMGQREAQCWFLRSFLVVHICPRKTLYHSRSQLESCETEFQLFSPKLEALDSRRISLVNSIRKGSGESDIEGFVTVEQAEDKCVVLKLWDVDEKEKKLIEKKSMVMNDFKLKGSSINSRGVCLLEIAVREARDKHELSKDSGSRGLSRHKFVKLYTFNLSLEKQIELDLGHLEIRKEYTVDYVSEKEVHFLNGYKFDRPWFSVTYSQGFGNEPLIWKIEYRGSQNES